MIALQVRTRTLTTALGLVVALGSTAAAQDTWTPKALMPIGRYGHAAAEVNGKVHVIGGAQLRNCNRELKTQDVYDEAAGTWSSTAPAMTVARMHAGAAAIGSRLYVVGGDITCTAQTSSVEVYDESTNAWSSVAPLPSPRSAVAVAAVGGKLYAIGGYSAGTILDTVVEYDPATNAWTPKAPMPTAARASAVAAIDGLIYVAGGYADGLVALATLQIFNPATNTWTVGPAMSLARGYAAGGNADGRLFVIGGYNSFSSPVRNVSVYDPDAGWSDGPLLPAGRAELASASTHAALYALGGWTGSGVSRESYSIATDTTPPVLSLPSDIVVDPTSPAGAVVTYTATAIDNVDGPVPVTCAPASGSVFPIGTSLVSCSASDSHGNEADGTFTVTVRSPSQIVSDLVTATGDAGFQQATHLLHNAQRSISAPNSEAACGQLAAFINQVEAQAGKQVTDADAAAWIASASAARAALGCN